MAILRVSLLLFLVGVCPATAVTPTPTPGKTAVTDGHVVHDTGLLWNHVSNWGMLGSCPGTTLPFANAPSARWPGALGRNLLYQGGLWVGSKNLGEARVSTAAYNWEFWPGEAPEDTIYPAARGDAGGSRYPWAQPDDDLDGLEDEDPLNGIDDDGDLLVDEDFAAIGDQSFRCRYRDDTLTAQETYPDHTPQNLLVTQESYQWDLPRLHHAIGYEFTVENVGVTSLNDVFLGLFADFDLPAEPGGAGDDLAGSWSGMVRTESDAWVWVDLAYMRDYLLTFPDLGYAGIVLCRYTNDSEDTLHTRSVQIFRGQAPFSEGGDPVNDDERYDALYAPVHDADAAVPADYRVLMSCGPFDALAPGARVQLQVGLAAGEDLEDLLINAAELVLTYHGVAFDRDGDPANGAEYRVHWLPHEVLPSPVPDGDGLPGVSALALHAYPNPFNPRLRLELQLAEAGPCLLEIFDLKGHLVRRLELGEQPAGTVPAVWDGVDQAGRPAASGVYRVVARSGEAVAEKTVTLVR